MEDFEPLNPTLYHMLEKQFGEVRVSSPGEAISARYIPDLSDLDRERLEVDDPGEEYQVNCPFCSDTRFRLTINHTWGVPDLRGYRNLQLMRCYNEECQGYRENRDKMYDQIYRTFGCDIHAIKIRKGKTSVAGPQEIDPPGLVFPLDELAKTHPNHHAIEYLERRNFDPVKLSKVYGVSYCPESKFWQACDRIIIPLLEKDKLMGWQARHIGEWHKGMPAPKYWTAPGTRRKYLLYNFEYAIKHQTVVIAEGPMDVWGFGPQAVGCWGKTMSTPNRHKLVNSLRNDASVVILLDPKQDEKEKREGKAHHIEKLYEQLRPALKGRLLKIYLPDENSDPGSLDRGFMRNLIKDEAAKNGVKVSFGKP